MVLVYESSPGYYYLVKISTDKISTKATDKISTKATDKASNKTTDKASNKADSNFPQGQNTKRIPKKEYQKIVKKYNYNLDSIKIGDLVTIIVKPYNKGKNVSGKIKKILTKKKKHTRGHKVMLEDGTVGRMISVDK
jgi:uncharacterized repeat protein (TIGR03833 family)